MKNISADFDDVFLPVKGLVIYQSQNKTAPQTYVEAFDMDSRGCLINAHPLDLRESAALAKCLDSSEELSKKFLKPKGLLPESVLYLDPANGKVIWFTKAQEVNLFFIKDLGIPCGRAKIPAMVWKADKEELYVYALKSNKKLAEKTPLYHAPFFNLYQDGKVCMGTVDIRLDDCNCLEDFISQWRAYFFDSYFSHLINGHNPIDGNLSSLWQQQLNSRANFPNDVLIPCNKTVKNLIR